MYNVCTGAVAVDCFELAAGLGLGADAATANVEKPSHHTPDNPAMPYITIPRHPLRAGMENPAGLFVMLAFPNMVD
jgi:hypothetical protein